MRHLKSFTTLLGVLVLVGVLVGCAGSNSDEPSDEPGVFATASGPQSVLVWHPFTGPQQAALEQLRLDFEVAFPAIDLQLVAVDEATLLTDYEAAALEGLGPDVLIARPTWLPVLVEHGVINPLDLSIYETLTGSITEAVLNVGHMDQDNYGFPLSGEIATLYCNRSRVLNVPNSIEVLYQYVGSYGMIAAPTFDTTAGLYLTGGGQLLDDNGSNLVTPEALQTYLTRLQTLATTPGITFSTDFTPFIAGQTGMLLASSNDYAALKAALGDSLAVVPLPLITPDNWRALVHVDAVLVTGINSTTAAHNASYQLLAYLAGADAQRIWFEQTARVPMNPLGLAQSDLAGAWGLGLEFAVYAPRTDSFRSAMLPVLDEAVRAVTLNGTDPTTAASQTAATLAALPTP